MKGQWLGVGVLIVVFGTGFLVRSDSQNADPHNLPKTSHSFHFRDITSEVGVHSVHRNPDFDLRLGEKPLFLYFGTGVAVADVNGDGWMDFFVPGAREGDSNHLYLNQQGQTFSEEARTWNIGQATQTGAQTSPVFFDYNNDGKPDLFIASLGCSRLYQNAGNHFLDVTTESGLGDCRNSLAAVPFDYDKDGLVDLFVIRYWPEKNYFQLSDPFLFPENFVDAKNAGKNSLFRNSGNGKFEDVTDKVGLVDSRWSMDAVMAEFFSEGDSHLYVANDFGADQRYQLRNGQFVNDTRKMGVPDRRFGMSTSLGDLDGSGFPALWVSNEYLSQYDERGSFLLKFDRNGRREDLARNYRVHDCGWTWGSAFSDFDLDGKEDLYVANGFISGKNGKDDTPGTFMVGVVMSQPGFLISDAKNWIDLKGGSYAGHQKDCIYLNRGDHFENVASQLGPNMEWDGRAVGLIDIDNNGTQDLIVTTQNGPVHVLKNEAIAGKHWIGFSLVGQHSNRDAMGAKVQVKQGNWKGYRWATAKTGFMASSDPRIHFGLPQELPVDVRVTWPDGSVFEKSGLETGKYYSFSER